MDATLGREADAVTVTLPASAPTEVIPVPGRASHRPVAAEPSVEQQRAAFLGALADAPFRYDFYQTLRRLECLYKDKPRWGRAARPADEPIRLGQDPDLAFAPAPLASFERGADGAPSRLQVRLFGLLGPNGPLPIHLTDFVRERLRHGGDPTLSRFLDVFHHRFLALFYRAWAQAQPHVNYDRPEDDRFAFYIAAFFGLTLPSFRGRDSVPDNAKLFHVGALVRHVRNADGLAAILAQFFGVPAAIEQFVPHWLQLPREERTRLNGENAGLGRTAVAGRRVWDCQNKFRVRLGPLSLGEYQSFLPGGHRLQQLTDWIRLYLCMELEWDVRLVLRKDEVPPLRLGRKGCRLGWTTWLGSQTLTGDADDLCLNAEAFLTSAGASAHE